MEMRHVKTFCRQLWKYGNFSKAAHALGYGNLLFTHIMKALETDYIFLFSDR